MRNSDRLRIKNKILKIEPKRWWGDDSDVRFYLISKLSSIKNKTILDIGGGIGIILSEIDNSNHRINLDLSFEDLIICKNKTDKNIINVCGSMTHLPFRDNSFDYVIVANVLEIGKEIDLNNKLKKDEYPTITKLLKDIQRIAKPEGTILFTTPNNEYYKSIKLTYDELKNAILSFFSEFQIFYYNTFPRLTRKSRKLNMANVMPKLLTKMKRGSPIIQSLCKTKSQNNYSVSFFVEVKNRRDK